MTAQSNHNGQQPQQPNPQTVISIQRGEIDRLNDNRVYLMAISEENRMAAAAEIARLTQEIVDLRAAADLESKFAQEQHPTE
jgi:uncharacterized protein YigA (DUF484 family)